LQTGIYIQMYKAAVTPLIYAYPGDTVFERHL